MLCVELKGGDLVHDVYLRPIPQNREQLFEIALGDHDPEGPRFPVFIIGLLLANEKTDLPGPDPFTTI
jgi:hypothetical protein